MHLMPLWLPCWNSWKHLRVHDWRNPYYIFSHLRRWSNTPSGQPWQCSKATHSYRVLPKVRFLYNRLNTYDLHEDYYNAEVTTTQNILHNNAFPIHPPTPQPTPNTNQKHLTTTRAHTPTPKWATFTHIRKETNFISNLFKKTNVKITIQRLLTLWGPTSNYARQCVPLHEVQRLARLDTLYCYAFCCVQETHAIYYVLYELLGGWVDLSRRQM